MRAAIDITEKTTEAIKSLLGDSGKAVLCLVLWTKLVFVQSRVQTDPGLITEYEENLKNNIPMPPAQGMMDESGNVYVFDGIHTTSARNNRGEEAVPVLLRLGSRTEAEMEASRANATHGAKRTPADKRHAVELLLRNSELCARSNNWLAATAAVSPQLVESVREALERDTDAPVFRPKKRRVTRNGSSWEVNAPRKKSSVASSKKTAYTETPERLAERMAKPMLVRLAKLPDQTRSFICHEIVKAIQAIL